MASESGFSDGDPGDCRPGKMTPRQGLIYAALVGWRGDDASDWLAPVDRETLGRVDI